MKREYYFKEDEKRIDELVAMIDKLMSEGGGHVNVSAENSSVQGEDSICVDTYKSSDKSINLGACCEPTAELDEGDDDEL